MKALRRKCQRTNDFIFCVCATGQSRWKEASEGRSQNFPSGNRPVRQLDQQTAGERLHIQARSDKRPVTSPIQGFTVLLRMLKRDLCDMWFNLNLVTSGLQNILLHSGQAAR